MGLFEVRITLRELKIGGYLGLHWRFWIKLETWEFWSKRVDIPLPKPGIITTIVLYLRPTSRPQKKQEEGSLPASTIVLYCGLHLTTIKKKKKLRDHSVPAVKGFQYPSKKRV